MIKQIAIKNFAIIDDLIIDFQPGFSVFTGETGAGKSIIIEALGLLTGERASATMVRHGTNKAVIEGVFELSDELLSKANLNDYAEDHLIIISKEIDISGKSTCRINNRITTLSTIRKVASQIIDIHSQQDNQYLLNKAYHLDLLDAFGATKINKAKADYQVAYQTYQGLKQELSELQTLNYNPDLLELMKYQYQEIENAKLTENEVEQLDIEQKRLQDLSKLTDRINEIEGNLGGDTGAVTTLYKAKKAIDAMSNDPLFAKYVQGFDDMYYQLNDLYQSLKADFDGLDYDEYHINKLQERIFEINKLKRKYGSTTAQILQKQQDLAHSISKMEQQTTRLGELANLIAQQLIVVTKAGQQLDAQRLLVSKDLIKAIQKHLQDLYLKDAKFDIIVTPLSEPGSKGISEMEFSTSLNPGTPLLPLVKVASGGEMSRLMLGLKIVFNTLYGISTSIFDEIDVGISGKVSRAVGLKMCELAEQTQVICITHSPQVASLGNHQYVVEKSVKSGSTFTSVRHLTPTERVTEIAKMLSGASEVGAAALANAQELLKK